MRFFQGAVGVIETSHTCRANQCRNHKNVCILWVAGWQPGKVSTKDTLSPISYTTMASIVLSGYSIRNVLVWYVYIYIYLCRIWYKDVHHQTSSIQKWCGNLQVDCRSSLKPLSSRGSIIHVLLNHEIMIREPSFDAESLRSLGITGVSPRILVCSQISQARGLRNNICPSRHRACLGGWNVTLKRNDITAAIRGHHVPMLTTISRGPLKTQCGHWPPPGSTASGEQRICQELPQNDDFLPQLTSYREGISVQRRKSTAQLPVASYSVYISKSLLWEIHGKDWFFFVW